MVIHNHPLLGNPGNTTAFSNAIPDTESHSFKSLSNHSVCSHYIITRSLNSLKLVLENQEMFARLKSMSATDMQSSSSSSSSPSSFLTTISELNDSCIELEQGNNIELLT